MGRAYFLYMQLRIQHCVKMMLVLCVIMFNCTPVASTAVASNDSSVSHIDNDCLRKGGSVFRVNNSGVLNTFSTPRYYDGAFDRWGYAHRGFSTSQMSEYRVLCSYTAQVRGVHEGNSDGDGNDTQVGWPP